MMMRSIAGFKSAGLRSSSRSRDHDCSQRRVGPGIPNLLSPPSFFRIATVRTGGGKYVPDDMRFAKLQVKLSPCRSLFCHQKTPLFLLLLPAVPKLRALKEAQQGARLT